MQVGREGEAAAAASTLVAVARQIVVIDVEQVDKWFVSHRLSGLRMVKVHGVGVAELRLHKRVPGHSGWSDYDRPARHRAGARVAHHLEVRVSTDSQRLHHVVNKDRHTDYGRQERPGPSHAQHHDARTRAVLFANEPGQSKLKTPGTVGHQRRLLLTGVMDMHTHTCGDAGGVWHTYGTSREIVCPVSAWRFLTTLPHRRTGEHNTGPLYRSRLTG